MMMQKTGFCFTCPFESCFFSLQYTLKNIQCQYIFIIYVNEVISNTFSIIKIAALKITVLYICYFYRIIYSIKITSNNLLEE